MKMEHAIHGNLMLWVGRNQLCTWCFWQGITNKRCIYIGLARTINIRCIYGIFGREIAKCTVIYGVYIQFWPTLHIYGVCIRCMYKFWPMPLSVMYVYSSGQPYLYMWELACVQLIVFVLAICMHGLHWRNMVWPTCALLASVCMGAHTNTYTHVTLTHTHIYE
jgi:hypothetical protein